MTTIQRKIGTAVSYVLAGFVILAALLVSITHVLTPVLNDHLTDFEIFAGRLLERTIKIKEVEMAWNFYEPELIFRDVVVLDQKTQRPTLQVPLIKIDLAILPSLLNRTFIFEKLTVSGVRLTLRQQKSGAVNVEGFKNFLLTDNMTGQSLSPNAAFEWIFSQPKLVLQNFDVHYFPINEPEKFITLKWLALTNTTNNHVLTGKATLNQDVPTHVGIDFNWTGSVTDFSHISAELSLSLEGISLPQWFYKQTWHDWHFEEGVGSAKIWANWNNNNWQKMKATLQFYDVQADSIATDNNINISRLSGDVRWERQGDLQVITGENMLIDLPDHLWPTTNFAIKFIESPEGAPIVQHVQVNYLDLADSIKVARGAGLLLPEDQKLITSFAPQGELHNFQADIRGSVNDPANFSISTQLSKLSFQAWKKLPSITHLYGTFFWDGSQGNLELDSRQTTVALNYIFNDPIILEKLSGALSWKKNTNGAWIVTAKNIQASNLDVDVNTNFLLTIPEKDLSVIDLSSSFSIKNAAHVTRYLPEKIFDPELVTWLNKAFLSGEVSGGYAVLQGKLDDFPFANGKGKFEIGGTLKDVELNYAPDWPTIQNINGKLVFSGKSMRVDLLNGRTVDVPLGAVHAEIPDLDKAVLTVHNSTQADLSQGLQFIQKSPLQQTIGKDLKELNLQGPMQLSLELTVPLEHPTNTTVKGHTVISDATLSLNDWNLAIYKLNGAFDFTENSVVANNMIGRLFSNPITLNLSTQSSVNKKTDYLLAKLQGVINLADIKTWLNLPIENIFAGETHYQAEIMLPSQHVANQVTQVMIQSDLKGVAVKLPAGYGKKAEDPLALQLNLNVAENQPLKIKAIYGKLFSFAATLQRIRQQFEFLSGDLHLGSGEANWQTQPGIIVTGDIDEINLDKAKSYLAEFMGASKISSSSMELFRGVDVRTKILNFSGVVLKNIRIQLSKKANSFLLGLENADMAGEITLPRGDLQQGIQARFQRLNLSSLASDANVKANIKLRDLPAISFVGDNVRYGDILFGHTNLNLIPSSSGLAIKQLDLESSAYQLHATGQSSNAKTHLQGDLTTNHVNDWLKDWGFHSDNLVGNKADVHFDLNWSSDLFSPSIKALSGMVSLKLGEGRIINLSESTNAQMGLGGLLNIFSLQNLPRRLSLNFSDVFQKGYSFDSMKGDFVLRNGSAVTKEIRFVGPVAEIKIAGRIGLAVKDLDMKLAVTPHVTASLPVVAAVATANPIAGIATWVLDKVVSGAVSNMTTYTYTITGSWSNPVWTHIATQPVATHR